MRLAILAAVTASGLMSIIPASAAEMPKEVTGAYLLLNWKELVGQRVIISGGYATFLYSDPREIRGTYTAVSAGIPFRTKPASGGEGMQWLLDHCSPNTGNYKNCSGTITGTPTADETYQMVLENVEFEPNK